MDFRKILQILTACLLASCTTSQLENNDTYADEEDPYFGSFEVMAARMGVVLARPEHDTDQVTFLLYDSFTHSIAIASYYDRDQTDPLTRGFLLVSIRDIQSDVFEHQDGVTRGSYTFQIYETVITADQFSKIREQASSADFLAQPFSTRAPGVSPPPCLDGTTYAIGARLNGKNHVVERHNCDEGFSQAIASAAPLIAAAKSAFPELENLLTEGESNIKSWD